MENVKTCALSSLSLLFLGFPFAGEQLERLILTLDQSGSFLAFSSFYHPAKPTHWSVLCLCLSCIKCPGEIPQLCGQAPPEGHGLQHRLHLPLGTGKAMPLNALGQLPSCFPQWLLQTLTVPSSPHMTMTDDRGTCFTAKQRQGCPQPPPATPQRSRNNTHSARLPPRRAQGQRHRLKTGLSFLPTSPGLWLCFISNLPLSTGSRPSNIP